MAKGKKKKKDLDFQKVKLKVGRRLKRDINETKAEFSSRKIILKEVKSYSDDPLTALARHSDHISHNGKLSMLNHFNSALTPDIVKSLNKPILDSLSKFLVDHSDQVRGATIKCLKTCYNHIKNQHLSTKDFMQSLKPYLDCAYTHVSAGISADCHRFVEYFVSINDPQIFEPLMEIVLRRYEAGNLSAGVENLAIKLRRYFVRHKQKQLVEAMLTSDRIEPLFWTKTNFVLDLDWCIHDFGGKLMDPEREVQLVRVHKKEDVGEKYLEVIKDDQDASVPDKIITTKQQANARPAKRQRRMF